MSAEESAASVQAGADLIAAERQRQIDVEGWTPEHANDALWDAARCYFSAARYAKATQLTQPMPKWARDNEGFWPWEEEVWKPSTDPIRNLVKAGALIAAEIDRLAALSTPSLPEARS